MTCATLDRIVRRRTQRLKEQPRTSRGKFIREVDDPGSHHHPELANRMASAPWT